MNKDDNAGNSDDDLSSSEESELETPRMFRYVKEAEDMYDDFTYHVKSVTFEIYRIHHSLKECSARGAALTHTIKFPKMVSLTHAVRAAENYLTLDVTKEYCTDIQRKGVSTVLALDEQTSVRGDILLMSCYNHTASTLTSEKNALLLLKDLIVDDRGNLTLICSTI